MQKHKVTVAANENSEMTSRYPLGLYVNDDNGLIHKFIRVARA